MAELAAAAAVERQFRFSRQLPVASYQSNVTKTAKNAIAIRDFGGGCTGAICRILSKFFNFFKFTRAFYVVDAVVAVENPCFVTNVVRVVSVRNVTGS
ncbi:MAG: hypothetical protein LCI00_12180 [Chloroflexi bacterium]|nr:hypothetical protein [Chloroflexota bacterium]MCC6896234.1 hypothetical protein [Anaerolineae bacterium]